MTSIYQAIYETLNDDAYEVSKLLTLGDVRSVSIRRDPVIRFLEENEWNLDKFLEWHKKDKRLPSRMQMAKNLVTAGGQALASGMRKVSEIERLERLVICDSCPMISRKDFRCYKCGCWASHKSRLEAWHCPIDKW